MAERKKQSTKKQIQTHNIIDKLTGRKYKHKKHNKHKKNKKHKIKETGKYDKHSKRRVENREEFIQKK